MKASSNLQACCKGQQARLLPCNADMAGETQGRMVPVGRSPVGADDGRQRPTLTVKVVSGGHWPV